MRTDVVKLNPWLASIALALLSGCAVGPQYHAPTATLAPLHSAAAAEARSQTLPAPPLDQWWSGFQDPVLNRIVQRTLEQNLDLSAAAARVQRSRALAQEAGAQLLPAGALEASAEPLHQSLDSPIGTIGHHLPGYNRNLTLYDLGVGASWEIDLFGGLRRRAEAAGAQAEATEAERQGVRVAVAAEAADAYLQLRGDQVRLRVVQDQIATDSNLLELVKLRFAAGAAADREVAQAQALLAAANASEPPLRRGIEAQLNRLDVLMGAQPGTYAMEFSAPAEIPGVPAVSAADAPQNLLRRRPDIMAAERRVAVANADVGAAIAEYYPKVSLAGLVGVESLGASTLISSDAFQPAATLGLRWRLFDFHRVDAEVSQARGAQAEALAQYRQTVLLAAEDVENSLTSLVQLEQQTASLRQEVASLVRARDTAQEDYKAGAIALTDVLDADRELLAAQDDLAQTRAGTARAAVAVYRSLGGGWHCMSTSPHDQPQ